MEASLHRSIDMSNKKESRASKERENPSLESTTGLKCMFHPHKSIHNFCRNKHCLLPMCSVCIGLHTEQHRCENTFGQYVSIDEVVHEIRSVLEKGCRTLQEYSQNYTNDYDSKCKAIQQCRAKIYTSKARIMRDIEKSFELLEKNLLDELTEYEQKLHDVYQQLQGKIHLVYSSLKSQIDTFTSEDKVLKNVITYYSEGHNDAIKQNLIQFGDKMAELKKKGIKVEVNQEIIKNYKEILSVIRIFELSEPHPLKDSSYIVKQEQLNKNGQTERKSLNSSSQVKQAVVQKQHYQQFQKSK